MLILFGKQCHSKVFVQQQEEERLLDDTLGISINFIVNNEEEIDG